MTINSNIYRLNKFIVVRICALCVAHKYISRVARFCCHRHHHHRRRCRLYRFLSSMSLVRTTKCQMMKWNEMDMFEVYMHIHVQEYIIYVCLANNNSCMIEAMEQVPSLPNPDVWILAHVFAYIALYWHLLIQIPSNAIHICSVSHVNFGYCLRGGAGWACVWDDVDIYMFLCMRHVLSPNRQSNRLVLLKFKYKTPSRRCLCQVN